MTDEGEQEEPLTEPFSMGCALVIKGESLKASQFVNHNASLGVLREKIVRRQLVDQVHGRFRVETGIAYNPGRKESFQHREPQHSSQIDLLIHDHMNFVPFYRWDDFVVVHYAAVKAAIEIKSHLNHDEFANILKFHESVCCLREHPYGRDSTFAFALEGVKFGTFLEYMSQSKDVDSNKFLGNHRFPIAIACQSENYIAVRPSMLIGEQDLYCCAVRAKQVDSGICTGMFINSVSTLIDSHERFSSYAIYQWYNMLPDQHFEKYYLNVSGEWQSGKITFP